MAALNEEDRQRVWRTFMRENKSATPFLKTALRAAVDATDEWIEANQAAYNAALPSGAQSFRTLATLEQKTWLFCYVAMRRAGLPLSVGD